MGAENPETVNLHGVATASHRHLGFKTGMVIASLNINGLCSHLDEVQLLVNNLGIQIVALNETKLDSSIAKELTNISGYQQKRLDRTCNGGGVSIYLRDSVRFKPRDNVPVDDLELICIEIEPPKCKPLLVVAWYRPPGGLVGTFERWKRFSLFWIKRAKK